MLNNYSIYITTGLIPLTNEEPSAVDPLLFRAVFRDSETHPLELTYGLSTSTHGFTRFHSNALTPLSNQYTHNTLTGNRHAESPGTRKQETYSTQGRVFGTEQTAKYNIADYTDNDPDINTITTNVELSNAGKRIGAAFQTHSKNRERHCEARLTPAQLEHFRSQLQHDTTQANTTRPKQSTLITPDGSEYPVNTQTAHSVSFNAYTHID